MKVIIPSAETRIINSKDGKRQFRVQRAGLVSPDGLANTFEIWHSGNEQPYPAGQFEIDPEKSIYVDRQGGLAIRPHLRPLAVAGK